LTGLSCSVTRREACTPARNCVVTSHAEGEAEESPLQRGEKMSRRFAIMHHDTLHAPFLNRQNEQYG